MGCFFSEVVQKEGHQFCNITLLKLFFFTFSILKKEKKYYMKKRKLLKKYWFEGMGLGSNLEMYNTESQTNSQQDSAASGDENDENQ